MGLEATSLFNFYFFFSHPEIFFFCHQHFCWGLILTYLRIRNRLIVKLVEFVPFGNEHIATFARWSEIQWKWDIIFQCNQFDGGYTKDECHVAIDMTYETLAWSFKCWPNHLEPRCICLCHRRRYCCCCFLFLVVFLLIRYDTLTQYLNVQGLAQKPLTVWRVKHFNSIDNEGVFISIDDNRHLSLL